MYFNSVLLNLGLPGTFSYFWTFLLDVFFFFYV